MSAEDKLRSFAEARVDGNTVIRDGLTYGDVRCILAELCVARKTRDAAQEAGTKAVMERRAVEEELRRHFCPVCGGNLTLACPSCEVA